MGVPALLVDFPPPSSPGHAAAARHLGRQWPIFWSMGNVFFRPISTLGIFGYGYAGYCAYRSGEFASGLSSELGMDDAKFPSQHRWLSGACQAVATGQCLYLISTSSFGKGC